MTVEIYKAVYHKISALTEGKIANVVLTAALPASVTHLASAKIAYQALYEQFENSVSWPIIFAVFAPHLLTHMLTSCFGEAFLTKQGEQLAMLTARFRAMEKEKNAALHKELALLQQKNIEILMKCKRPSVVQKQRKQP